MEKLEHHHLASGANLAIGGQAQRDDRFAIGQGQEFPSDDEFNAELRRPLVVDLQRRRDEANDRKASGA